MTEILKSNPYLEEVTHLHKSINLKINGYSYDLNIKSSAMLIDVLRDNLGLTGTKSGCNGRGTCGACTVIVDKQAVLSCLTIAASVEGKEITTIEGMSDGENLHPIQASFIKNGAIQCGFCTPGMIMSAKALLDANGNPTTEDIRIGLAGNLCRCTGYNKIVKAVGDAAEQIRFDKCAAV